MKKLSVLLLIALLILFSFLTFSQAKYRPYRLVEVENFKANSSLSSNRLYGQHGLIFQKPSRVNIIVKDKIAHLSFDKKDKNPVGFFTVLPFKNKKYFNAENFDELEIIGSFPEDKDFFLAVIEPKGKKQLEKKHLLPVNKYKVSSERFIFPLSSFPQINWQRISKLHIYANNKGAGEFQLQRINFIDHNAPGLQDTSPGIFLIDNFDSNINSLGNKDLYYLQAPSKIDIRRMAKDVSQQDRCLEISSVNQGNGWGIYALPLKKGEEYFNAERYRTLILKVRGEKGGEDAEIALTDKNPRTKRAPWKAGKLSKYLRKPLTTNWAEVLIPLTEFGAIPQNEINEFLVIFPDAKKTTIYIDDLKFSTREFLNIKAGPSERFIIHSFDNDLINDLGNRLKKFDQKPSWIKVRTTLKGGVTKDDPCLQIEYKKTLQGPCGFQTSLKENSRYFSASNYKELGFQVRGDETAVFEVYLVDKKAEVASKENQAVAFKKVAIQNLTGQWQWVTIPLRDLEIDKDNLSAIVFKFTEPGQAKLFIDNICFLSD